MNPPTTIKQRSITIELENSKVVVRRMKRAAACAFLKKLAGHLVNATGNGVGINLDKLPELILGADELSIDLVINSTDLGAEDVNKLDLLEFTAVLHAAVELNLGEELKNSFAGIASTLKALFPATPTNTGA